MNQTIASLPGLSPVENKERDCKINLRVIACSPDTISKCRTFHTGATASILTLFDKPFGSISVSR
jgi:hypothetical protein